MSVTDWHLRVLLGCTRLERVGLAKCCLISEQALLAGVSAWPSLITLELSHMGEAVSDAVLRAIGQTCKELRNIYLSACKLITDKGIIELVQGCPKLRRVSKSLFLGFIYAV